MIRPSAAALEQMDPFVRDMHTTSGLLPELAEGLELDDAAARVLEYIAARVPAGKGLRSARVDGSIGTRRRSSARHAMTTAHAAAGFTPSDSSTTTPADP